MSAIRRQGIRKTAPTNSNIRKATFCSSSARGTNENSDIFWTGSKVETGWY